MGDVSMQELVGSALSEFAFSPPLTPRDALCATDVVYLRFFVATLVTVHGMTPTQRREFNELLKRRDVDHNTFVPRLGMTVGEVCLHQLRMFKVRNKPACKRKAAGAARR